MSADSAVTMLNERFLLQYPAEAARALGAMPAAASIQVLQNQSPAALQRCWQALAPDRAAEVLTALPTARALSLVTACDPQAVVAALAHLEAARRATLLDALPAEQAEELRELMKCQDGTAGSLMDVRVGTLSGALTVAEAIERLRALRQHGLRELFVVDDQMNLDGQVDLEDLVLAGRERPIRDFMRPVPVVVRDTDPIARVADALQAQTMDVLPVVSEQGRFRGVIRLPELMTVLRLQGRWWQPSWRARGQR